MKKFLIIISLFVGTFTIYSLMPSQAKSEASTNSNAAADHQVSLLTDRAEPSIVLAKTGESIQFNSGDGKSHRISQGEGNDYGKNHGHAMAGIDSGIFRANEGYRVTIKEKGVYTFHDHTSPDIFATIVAY